MVKLSLIRPAVAVAGLALSVTFGAGVASADPDLGPIINTTCSYPQVIAALNATNGAWLVRMSGSGATCFAIYENTADAQRAAQRIQLDYPSWWVHAGVLS